MKKRYISTIIEGLKEGQALFRDTVSTVINTILLTLAYFIGIPLSLLFSLLKKEQLLDLRSDVESKSFWSELNLEKKE